MSRLATIKQLRFAVPGLGLKEAAAIVDSGRHHEILAAEESRLAELAAEVRVRNAAPIMLEALENLENDDGSIPEHAWVLVQAAIKKARGEA